MFFLCQKWFSRAGSRRAIKLSPRFQWICFQIWPLKFPIESYSMSKSLLQYNPLDNARKTNWYILIPTNRRSLEKRYFWQKWMTWLISRKNVLYPSGEETRFDEDAGNKRVATRAWAETCDANYAIIIASSKGIFIHNQSSTITIESASWTNTSGTSVTDLFFLINFYWVASKTGTTVIIPN